MTQVYSWGERGLVASLVHDVATCDDMRGWESLLDVILFPRNGRRVHDVWALVEPDFGNRGFGHPDLVIKISFVNETLPLVLFVEAKMSSFLRSTENVRSVKGFNSSINGQLELNHRLAIALSECRGIETPLTEPRWVGLLPLYHPVRYLKHTMVLEQVVSSLRGFPLSCYYHAVVTSDSANPIASIAKNRLPVILNAEGRDCSNEFTSGLFWTNWRSLYEMSSNSPACTFRANYDFMRCAQRNQAVVGQLPENRAKKGVTLVRVSPQFLPRPKPTYLYFSWKQPTGVRIFDFSGLARLPVSLPMNGSLCDLLANIEDEISLSNKKDCNDYPWWHARTVEANRSAWPDLWEASDAPTRPLQS